MQGSLGDQVTLPFSHRQIGDVLKEAGLVPYTHARPVLQGSSQVSPRLGGGQIFSKTPRPRSMATPWLLLGSLLHWAVAGGTVHVKHTLMLPEVAVQKLRSMCIAERKRDVDLVSSWIQTIWRDIRESEDAEDGKVVQDAMEQPELGVVEDDVESFLGELSPAVLAALKRPSFIDGLDLEPRRQYTLQVNGQRLKDLAGADRRLVVSWTTGGPKRWSIALNLGLSIRKNAPELEAIFVFIALDPDVLERAEAAGFNAVLQDRSGFGGDLEDEIWKMRWLIQTTCVALGLEVLVVDSDIVILSNPFQHFYQDSDIEAMTDHFFPAKHLWATWLRPAEHINTGFLFIRPSTRVLDPWLPEVATFG